jgi:ADP-ribose pyrophosphatase YjhB (NUDIX family)
MSAPTATPTFQRVVPFDPTQSQTDWHPLPVGPSSEVIRRGDSVQVVLVTHVDPATGKRTYSQILRAEKGGALNLLVDEQGRVGLATLYRPVTTDQQAWADAWPIISYDLLGRPSLELVRGFAQVGDANVTETALREGAEEAGLGFSAIHKLELLGYMVDNTTFSPHMTGVVVAWVDSSKLGTPTPDINEGLLKGVQWYTRDQLREAFKAGDLFCAYTLSAIFTAGLVDMLD